MDKSVVSIARSSSPDDYDAVDRAVTNSVDLIGGLETYVTQGDSVLIKPNVLLDMDYTTGAVTNPLVVKSLCRLARKAGAKKIIVAEGAVIGCKTGQAFEKSGYTSLSQEEEIELLDLKKCNTVFMSIANGVIFRRIAIPEVVLKSDVIINVPAMKTHDMVPATLGLKNMKGVLTDQDKKRFHVWGLEQAIVDLNKIVLPQLTVVDGTVGMEGLGPVHGKPVHLDLVVSSFDTVAADTVSASVMGIDPESIQYIQLAAQQGLGCADLSQIEIVGLSIDKVRRPFKVLHVDFEKYERELGIKIHEEGACSGCRQVVDTLLNNYLKGNLDVLKDYTLIFGQTVKVPGEIKGKLLNFGACTKRYKSQGQYIAGCPPMQEHVLEFFGMDPDTWTD